MTKHQTQNESTKLINEILSGNLEYPKRILTILFRRGFFPHIRTRGQQFMSMWQEEVSQEICTIILEKQSSIWAASGFIWTIVYRMSSNENKRLSRIYFFSELEKKGGLDVQFSKQSH